MSMHFIKHDTKIDFIGLRYYAFALSLLMILVGAVSLGLKGGPRYGIDFAGGVILQTKFETSTGIDALKKTLEDTKLVIITRDDLEEYFSKAPQVISSILQVLVSRLKATTKKALKVPNVPLGICRALQLFVLNGHMELAYDSAVRILADMFVTSPAAVEGYLAQLAEQGHLNISAPDHDQTKRTIRINSQDFLENVMKKKD